MLIPSLLVGLTQGSEKPTLTLAEWS